MLLARVTNSRILFAKRNLFSPQRFVCGIAIARELSMKVRVSPPRQAVDATGSAQTGKLMERVRSAIRVLHYSRRTEDSYAGWIRRFIVFHGKRHPDEMGEAEIGVFLTFLAAEKKVSASTQNQALAALLFLYRN